MSALQQYTSTPRSSSVRISTANTNRDGTGTIGTLFTGGTSGSRVDDISIKATSTTTAGMIRFYKSLDNGSTWRLLREVSVSAITPSGTVQSFESVLSDLGWILPAGSGGTTPLLGVSTNNAETFDVMVNRGGDF